MGPIRGPYSLYPRHVWASMLPKKETKYSYNAFQMTSQKSIQKWPMRHWKGNESWIITSCYTSIVYWLQPWSAGPLVQQLGGQAHDSRDKSECDSAVCSSLHGTQHRVAIWSFSSFLTWTVQLFLPGPWQFLLGPCPRGRYPGDGVVSVAKHMLWSFQLPFVVTSVTHPLESATIRFRSDNRPFSNYWREYWQQTVLCSC